MGKKDTEQPEQVQRFETLPDYIKETLSFHSIDIETIKMSASSDLSNNGLF